jgi:transposase
MLEKYPYSAAQVLQRLREQGFEGGYSIVKAYVHTIRPQRQPAFLKLAFAPGECAQVDWGLCRARHRPHYADIQTMRCN